MDEKRTDRYERLYLNPYDDITSIVRALKESNSPTVQLIIPPGMKVLNNEVNLRLLKFYIDDTSKEVLFITDDSEFIDMAREVGLKTVGYTKGEYEETSDEIIDILPYKKEEHLLPCKKIQRAPHSRKLKTMLSFLFILFFVGTVIYAFIPQVTVMITPDIKGISKTLTIKASSELQKIDEATLTLPATPLKVSFDISVTVPATGRKSIGKMRATGSVTFINQGDKSIYVPGGTRLSTVDGIFFRTNHDVSVPSSTSIYLGNLLLRFEAGTVSVPIEAEEKGTRGNITSGKICRIVDSKWNELQILNESSTSGGTDEVLAQITIEDIKAARAKLSREIEGRALSEITALLKTGDILLEGAMDIKEEEIDFNRNIEELALDVTASTIVSVDTMTLKKIQLEEALGEVFLRGLDKDSYLIEDSLEVRSISLNMLSNSTVELQAIVEGKIKANIDRPSLLKELRGTNNEKAREILSSMEGIGKFQIINREKDETDYDRVLPRWPFWIKIVVSE